MPSFQEILDLLNQIFPNQVQQILKIVAVLVGLWWALEILSKIKGLWTKEFSPLFYSVEDKRRVSRRRRFADHVESEIRRLNNLEAWSDYRFAELEAEVEAEGRQRIFSVMPFLQRSRSGLRREKSLSKALETSQERLILVEGEPGSGKSVALRHVAQSMAHRAMKSRSAKNIVPIYINLKELKPDKDEAVDRNLIQAFVLKSLNRANDRDIEEFLESEFDKGLQDGTWLFLFDSFDEIPDVLSSTEADSIIRKYSDAISDFLHGLNLCRGIVASRQFRGPGQSGWPRFRILQLSETRRAELVRKADLGTELQTAIVGQLGIAGDEIRGMVSNPMFLGLLCDYMRAGHSFPQNAHSVYETYVETRLNRDQERLQRRFKLKPTDIRATAENIAFCMAADSGLGLTPTRENIIKAMKHLELRVPKNIISHLDALEYIKLARSETATAAGDSKPFTFAHRRFQEYFATCIVLREPKRVAPRLLLTDARWRETAVVICQTQPADLLFPIIKESRKILIEMMRAVPELINKPLEYLDESQKTTTETNQLPTTFPWPVGMLHFAGLLQDGFVNHLGDLPDDIRLDIGKILLSASKDGTLPDRKWALEVAGIVPSGILLWLLRNAFAGESQWLSEVAFRQTARLSEIPNDIARSIRFALLNMFITGRLRRERHAIYAHLARLDKASHFINSFQVLLWANPIDGGFHFILFFLLVAKFMRESHTYLFLAVNIILLVLLNILSYRSLRLLPVLFIVISLPLRQRQQMFKAQQINYLFSVFAMELRVVIVGFAAILFFPFSLLFTWAPFSLLAALAGEFTHPLWWFAMPIWPLLYILKNVKKILVAFWKWLQMNWKILVFWIILFLPATLLMALLIIILSPVLLITPIALFVIPGLWIIDWVYWQQWVKRKETSIKLRDFHDITTRFHYRSFRNRFVKLVREQGLLVADKDTEVYIRKLALAVEYAAFAQNKRLQKMIDENRKSVWRSFISPFTNTWKPLFEYISKRKLSSSKGADDQARSIPEDFFSFWLSNYERNNKERLAAWGSEFLDEIWKLSEQVHANRRDK